jgi:hypothetical protein
VRRPGVLGGAPAVCRADGSAGEAFVCELAVTEKVVLLVVSIVSAAEVALVSVFEYSCPLTAEPPLAPQVPSVYSCADSVPFSGAPLAGETVAVSFGSHVWAEALAVVSLTVKHSVDEASLEPV